MGFDEGGRTPTQYCPTSPAKRIITATWIFKVAGTPRGITAMQMDIKGDRVVARNLCRGLGAGPERLACRSSARCARLSPSPAPRPAATHRASCRSRSPSTASVTSSARVVALFAASRKDTGCRINVEDDGTVQIAATDVEAGQKALSIIEGLTQEAEVGKIYAGKVRSIKDFGAFVEILPGTDGLPAHFPRLPTTTSTTCVTTSTKADEVIGESREHRRARSHSVVDQGAHRRGKRKDRAEGRLVAGRMMSTPFPSKNSIERNWHIIDAEGQVPRSDGDARSRSC